MPLAAEHRARAVAGVSLAHAECAHPSDYQDVVSRILGHHESVEAFDRHMKLVLLLQPLSRGARASPPSLRRAPRVEYDWSAVDDFLASPSQHAMCVTAGAARKPRVAYLISYPQGIRACMGIRPTSVLVTRMPAGFGTI